MTKPEIRQSGNGYRSMFRQSLFHPQRKLMMKKILANNKKASRDKKISFKNFFDQYLCDQNFFSIKNKIRQKKKSDTSMCVSIPFSRNICIIITIPDINCQMLISINLCIFCQNTTLLKKLSRGKICVANFIPPRKWCKSG